MYANDAIILDDHKMFAESFAVVLERYSLFKHVHTFYEGDDCIQFLLKNNYSPYYIFIDYQLQTRNGLSVMADIRRINKHCKIIFLTSTTSWSVVNHIQRYQPDAILSKLDGVDTLIQCLYRVGEGQYYLCEEFKKLKELGMTDYKVFTPREIEILQYFVEGNTTASTAEKTFLSKHTIIAHKRNMMAKAKCKNISQLIAFARNKGLVQ